MSSTTAKPRSANRVSSSQNGTDPKEVLTEEIFCRMISMERKRSERTQRPFVLLLMDTGRPTPTEKNGRILLDILSALQAATRETDVMGWYETNAAVGVMFTEITLENNLILSTILSRISEVLRGRLTNEQFSQIKFSFHLFPEEWDPNTPDRQSNPTLYPDLHKRNGANRLSRSLKRGMDILGSVLLLITLSPVFFVIAAAIKLTSRGPVLFRQQRIGEHGTAFTFLKFRSMYVNNDASKHKEYVRQLIAGEAAKHTNSAGEGIFKLTNDPRITPVGNFLRRTSLDELPQFLNVLRGDMSLVGPRPPVAYEFRVYDIWHRRRVLEVKPGVTGLWQVSGRSRTSFDDMVRLDLRYSQSWSLWLDLKILAATPRAVLTGDGAY